jgi:uncharacterized protein (DUF4415 family)
MEIKAAAKHSPVFDPDCPPSGLTALAEFATKAKSLRMRTAKPAVTIRLTSECLEAYKALGRGYTGVMADVLTYAITNPEFLTRYASEAQHS